MAHWTRLRCRSPASTFSGRERARASAELIRSRRWKRRKRGDLSLFLFSITNEGIVFFFLPNCHDCPGIEEEKKNHHLDSYMYYSIDKKLYTCRPPEKKEKFSLPLACCAPGRFPLSVPVEPRILSLCRIVRRASTSITLRLRKRNRWWFNWAAIKSTRGDYVCGHLIVVAALLPSGRAADVVDSFLPCATIRC